MFNIKNAKAERVKRVQRSDDSRKEPYGVESSPTIDARHLRKSLRHSAWT